MNRAVRTLAAVTFAVLGPVAAKGVAHTQTTAAKSAVNLKALFFDTRNASYKKPFGAVPTGTKVTFAMRAAHGNLTRATLNLTQVDAASNKQLATDTVKLKKKAGSKYDTWSGTFTPSSIGLYNYSFTVSNGKSIAYYTSNAAQEGGPGEASRAKPDVFFHLTAYSPSFAAPSWAANAVMYQIFPDRFYNGDPSNDTKLEPIPYGGGPSIHQNWTDRPTGGSDFFGGDLKGIDDKLPYLKGLGINVIYLNPIFLAPSNHKYDTSNYMEIDPHFGTQADFDKLVTDAKAAGIRLILDGVFNHTGSDSVYFDRYGQFPQVGAAESLSSPYESWYHFDHWPTSYDAFFGIDTLPTLQEVDGVKDFIFRKPDSIAQHWLSLGTSGWRLDAAHLKSHQWWREFRQSVKAAYPDSILICECDEAPIDATPWLLGNEVDGAMNYRFRDAVLRFFANGRDASITLPSTASGFSNALMSILEDYPKPAVMSSMNLVDSHDTTRILTDLLDKKDVLREVATLQMTWLGIPHIYYGDETGLQGNSDPDDRRTFPWDSRDQSLEGYYRKLIAIRHAHSELQNGSVTPVVIDNKHSTFGYLRTNAKGTTAVLINNSGKTVTESMKVKGVKNGTKLTDALNGGSYTGTKGAVKLTLKAHTSAILVKP